jgi:hypothetical protein
VLICQVRLALALPDAALQQQLMAEAAASVRGNALLAAMIPQLLLGRLAGLPQHLQMQLATAANAALAPAAL